MMLFTVLLFTKITIVFFCYFPSVNATDVVSNLFTNEADSEPKQSAKRIIPDIEKDRLQKEKEREKARAKVEEEIKSGDNR